MKNVKNQWCFELINYGKCWAGTLEKIDYIFNIKHHVWISILSHFSPALDQFCEFYSTILEIYNGMSLWLVNIIFKTVRWITMEKLWFTVKEPATLQSKYDFILVRWLKLSRNNGVKWSSFMKYLKFPYINIFPINILWLKKREKKNTFIIFSRICFSLFHACWRFILGPVMAFILPAQPLGSKNFDL